MFIGKEGNVEINTTAGKTTSKAEIKGKDVIFDENGNFIKAEK